MKVFNKISNNESGDEQHEEIGIYVDGSMTLPYEKVSDDIVAGNMVVRDLFDVSWRCVDHPEAIAPTGVYVELTFDLGVEKDAQVVAMTYKDEQWNPVASVVNNGDGTVTCVFENFCPVDRSDGGCSRCSGCVGSVWP